MPHLVLRKVLEAEEHDCNVCGFQCFHAGHIGVARLNFARGRINIEKHGAFEAVVLYQQPSERWKRFFGAILVIAGKEHDVFASARAAGTCGEASRLNSGGSPPLPVGDKVS